MSDVAESFQIEQPWRASWKRRHWSQVPEEVKGSDVGRAAGLHAFGDHGKALVSTLTVVGPPGGSQGEVIDMGLPKERHDPTWHCSGYVFPTSSQNKVRLREVKSLT